MAHRQSPTRTVAHTIPAPRAAAEPQDRTPAEVAADLEWLRTLRANVQQRWGGVYGGHDAHLDTLAEPDDWQEVDPADPLFRRCGCPSDEPCQGHPGDDDDGQGDGLDEDRLLEREMFEPDLGDDEPSEWN